MPKPNLSKILSANVIQSPQDDERFGLDWTKVKLGEIVFQQDTREVLVVINLDELDNPFGYLNLTANAIGITQVLGTTGEITISVVGTIATISLANPLVLTGKTVTGGTFNGPTINDAVMVAPALGTPVSGIATNLTGTALGLTAGNVVNVGLTGDVTTIGTVATLATVNGAPGTFGTSTLIPVVTVNAKGLVTLITTVAIPASQPPGNYLTALTGDVTAAGPGSVAATLATVNGAPGTFGSAALIPIITVNGKGLVTSVTTVAMAAVDAGSLTGSTLAANVVNASLNNITPVGGTLTTVGDFQAWTLGARASGRLRLWDLNNVDYVHVNNPGTDTATQYFNFTSNGSGPVAYQFNTYNGASPVVAMTIAPSGAVAMASALTVTGNITSRGRIASVPTSGNSSIVLQLPTSADRDLITFFDQIPGRQLEIGYWGSTATTAYGAVAGQGVINSQGTLVFAIADTKRMQLDTTALTVTGNVNSSGIIRGTQIQAVKPGATFAVIQTSAPFGDAAVYTDTDTGTNPVYFGQLPSLGGALSQFDVAIASQRRLTVSNAGAAVTGHVSSTESFTSTNGDVDNVGFRLFGSGTNRVSLVRNDSAGSLAGSALLTAYGNVAIMTNATTTVNSGTVVGLFFNGGLNVTGGIMASSGVIGSASGVALRLQAPTNTSVTIGVDGGSQLIVAGYSPVVISTGLTLGASGPALGSPELSVNAVTANTRSVIQVHATGTGYATIRLATVGDTSGWDINHNYPAAGNLSFFNLANSLLTLKLTTLGIVVIGDIINSSGKIGTTFGGANGNYILSGDDTSSANFLIFYNSSSAPIGSVNRVGSTNAVSYNTSSDARLKENVRDFTGDDSGRLIDGLRPRWFNWKDGTGDDVVGFLAQEEHAVDPLFARIGAVTVGDADPFEIKDRWARSDSNLVPILVAELKSVRTRLQLLEATGRN